MFNIKITLSFVQQSPLAWVNKPRDFRFKHSYNFIRGNTSGYEGQAHLPIWAQISSTSAHHFSCFDLPCVPAFTANLFVTYHLHLWLSPAVTGTCAVLYLRRHTGRRCAPKATSLLLKRGNLFGAIRGLLQLWNKTGRAKIESIICLLKLLLILVLFSF